MINLTVKRVVQGLGILSAVLMLVFLVLVRTPVQPTSVKTTPVVDRSGKSPEEIVGGFTDGLVSDGVEVTKQYVEGELPDLPRASSWSMYKEGPTTPPRYTIVANTGQEFTLVLGKDAQGWIVKRIEKKQAGELRASAGLSESRGSTGGRGLEGTPGTGTLDPGYGATSGEDTSGDDVEAAKAPVADLIKACQIGRMDKAAECFKGNPTGYGTIEQYLGMTRVSWSHGEVSGMTKVDDETYNVTMRYIGRFAGNKDTVLVVGKTDAGWKIVGIKVEPED